MMTPRERYLETYLFGKPDKVPFSPGGPRESTRAAWHQQGLPEDFNVVDRDGIIVYHGELDPSHTSNDLMPTGSSLRHALDLTLVDKPINWVPNPSFGCSVKWK